MNYMDRLAGTTRTNTPTVLRATVRDERTATIAGKAQERADWRPDREVLATMRQRHGVCG